MPSLFHTSHYLRRDETKIVHKQHAAFSVISPVLLLHEKQQAFHLVQIGESKVDDAVEAMSSIIEPVMIVLLGGIIGTMVLAMYLPIFKLASVF